jgi:hypothetical protein
MESLYTEISVTGFKPSAIGFYGKFSLNLLAHFCPKASLSWIQGEGLPVINVASLLNRDYSKVVVGLVMLCSVGGGVMVNTFNPLGDSNLCHTP